MIQNINKFFWSVTAGILYFFSLGSQVFAVDSGTNVVGIPNPLGAGNDTLFKFFTLLLDTIFPIATLISVFFVIYAGFRMVIFASNEEKLSEARMAFLWAIIGIAVLLGAKVLSAVVCGTVNQLMTSKLSC